MHANKQVINIYYLFQALLNYIVPVFNSAFKLNYVKINGIFYTVIIFSGGNTMRGYLDYRNTLILRAVIYGAYTLDVNHTLNIALHRVGYSTSSW